MSQITALGWERWAVWRGRQCVWRGSPARNGRCVCYTCQAGRGVGDACRHQQGPAEAGNRAASRVRLNSRRVHRGGACLRAGWWGAPLRRQQSQTHTGLATDTVAQSSNGTLSCVRTTAPALTPHTATSPHSRHQPTTGLQGQNPTRLLTPQYQPREGHRPDPKKSAKKGKGPKDTGSAVTPQYSQPCLGSKFRA